MSNTSRRCQARRRAVWRARVTRVTNKESLPQHGPGILMRGGGPAGEGPGAEESLESLESLGGWQFSHTPARWGKNPCTSLLSILENLFNIKGWK